MGEEEVLPDSQDEAELDISGILGREISPLREQGPISKYCFYSLHCGGTKGKERSFGMI